MNFIDIVQRFLQEQNLTTNVLFENKIISKNTFYKYKQRNPSLKTLIKIANFLKVDIDYLFERVDENNFKEYTKNQYKFYDKLTSLINSEKISNRKFCKDLNYSKDNILRYKNGVEPSVRTLLDISNYFDCSINDLLTRRK